jgi:NADH-quinone oxidoreductase subunit M
MYNLSLLVLIPALTVLGIILVKDLKKVRVVAAFGMIIQLFLAFWLLFAYLAERKAGNMAEVLFGSDIVWYESLNIRYSVGVDGVSVGLIVLTSIVIFAGIFASWTVKDLVKEFFIWLILLSGGVFGFFISLDLFTLFLFFEVAVIPMYLLIGIWGSGPKEYAAMKLTLMLMGASALLLVGLLGLYFYSAPDGGALTWNIIEISKVDIPIEVQRVLFPIVFIGFGVIGALFPFHTWSPDGHSSAPTAVSMLHAGVLMKLGGYGVLKVAIYLLPDAAREQGTFFLVLATIGVIYGALGAVMQKDLKYINAYSSVSHCGLVLFGILMLTQTAIDGAVLQMISHGLMTALFFALIGMIYGRTGTRMVDEMRGLMKALPFLSAVYVIAGLASLGLPGLSGFVAELTIFVGSFENPDMFSRIVTVIAVASVVVAAVYILRLVGRMLMGDVQSEEYFDFAKVQWYERISTISLLLFIVLMGMAPLWLSNMIMESLEPIMLRLN